MDKILNIDKISQEALHAFHNHEEEIISKVVLRSMQQVNEIAHHGQEAQRLISSGIRFTTKMLDAAMTTGEIALLEDQLTWAMDRLTHEGVKPEHLLHRLQIYADVVQETLPEHQAEEINQFVKWMVRRQQELMNQKK